MHPLSFSGDRVDQYLDGFHFTGIESVSCPGQAPPRSKGHGIPVKIVNQIAFGQFRRHGDSFLPPCHRRASQLHLAQAVSEIEAFRRLSGENGIPENQLPVGLFKHAAHRQWGIHFYVYGDPIEQKPIGQILCIKVGAGPLRQRKVGFLFQKCFDLFQGCRCTVLRQVLEKKRDGVKVDGEALCPVGVCHYPDTVFLCLRSQPRIWKHEIL